MIAEVGVYFRATQSRGHRYHQDRGDVAQLTKNVAKRTQFRVHRYHQDRVDVAQLTRNLRQNEPILCTLLTQSRSLKTIIKPEFCFERIGRLIRVRENGVVAVVGSARAGIHDRFRRCLDLADARDSISVLAGSAVRLRRGNALVIPVWERCGRPDRRQMQNLALASHEFVRQDRGVIPVGQKGEALRQRALRSGLTLSESVSSESRNSVHSIE